MEGLVLGCSWTKPGPACTTRAATALPGWHQGWETSSGLGETQRARPQGPHVKLCMQSHLHGSYLQDASPNNIQSLWNNRRWALSRMGSRRNEASLEPSRCAYRSLSCAVLSSLVSVSLRMRDEKMDFEGKNTQVNTCSWNEEFVQRNTGNY